MSTKSTVQVQKNALIAAAGTGGHIFPGLAVAESLISKGWNVIWMGTTTGMENRIIPQRNIQFESIEFSGIRGKGLVSWFTMPFKLIQATYDSYKIIVKTKPDVVLGFGGYVSLPAGLAAKLLAKKLVIHEQNSVVGLSNKALSYLTKYAFTAFPNVIPHASYVGNPLRAEFTNVAEPVARYHNRSGPIRILVIGGSLGAKFLNEIVPAAMSLLEEKNRPILKHQSGENQYDDLQSLYKKLKVEAEVVKFIDNTAIAFAEADLVICRAGASTVTEITAVGAAAMFVPLPSAVDDHQTKNAKYLVDHKAAWIEPQLELTPAKLANEILKMNRTMLLDMAIASKKLNMPNAANTIVNACEELAS